LLKAGFRVLAIDFRGRGQSHGPPSKSGEDGELSMTCWPQFATCARLAQRPYRLVGASFGGEAAADASIDAEPGEIDRLVLLAAWTDRAPEKEKGRKLFIVARDGRKR